ncbi:DinB family protein [Foetidibacter luteolus]|uniref:DinB family protein n=1 Tax=Foetidibacter luteolus TaxID=2608880 RepID=UPI00129B853F|nr:DinB family protein [Foetidibacter luteolus]
MNTTLNNTLQPATEQQVLTSEAFLAHWQGHRSLTRRVIDTFPEKELFSYSIGGMRPFAELAMEMVNMALPGIYGVATSAWKVPGKPDGFVLATPATKEELLQLWDEVTETVNNLWQQVEPGRFQQNDVAFGLYEGPVYSTIFYFIDNEIHHRGQGYVYLRSLGIEPPPFWER